MYKAFTDLIKAKNNLFRVYREAVTHEHGNSNIIIEKRETFWGEKNWSRYACFGGLRWFDKEKNIVDYRDPKLLSLNNNLYVLSTVVVSSFNVSEIVQGVFIRNVIPALFEPKPMDRSLLGGWFLSDVSGDSLLVYAPENGHLMEVKINRTLKIKSTFFPPVYKDSSEWTKLNNLCVIRRDSSFGYAVEKLPSGGSIVNNFSMETACPKLFRHSGQTLLATRTNRQLVVFNMKSLTPKFELSLGKCKDGGYFGYADGFLSFYKDGEIFTEKL